MQRNITDEKTFSFKDDNIGIIELLKNSIIFVLKTTKRNNNDMTVIVGLYHSFGKD